MEQRYKIHACAAATTAVLLLCFCSNGCVSVAAAGAVSRSVDHVELNDSETHLDQQSESGTETDSFDTDVRRQRHIPVRRQQKSFNIFGLKQGAPAERATAGERLGDKSITSFSDAAAHAPTQAAVRTLTKEIEEEADASTKWPTNVPLATGEAAEEQQLHQSVSKQEHEGGRLGASEHGEAIQAQRSSGSRRSWRGRQHQAKTVRRGAVAEESNAHNRSDDTRVQRQQEQEIEDQEEEDSEVSSPFPMRSTQHQTRKNQESEPDTHNPSNAIMNPAEGAQMADAFSEGMRRMMEAGFNIAHSAVEEDELSMRLLYPHKTKMEVLFRNTDFLGVHVSATGNVVCTTGGVYGFATSAGPGEGQPAGKDHSPVRVQIQRHSADVVVLIGGKASAIAAGNTIMEMPFASTVSESAAAAASEKGSKLVLVCTAPGEPLVAFPAKDVNVIQESVLNKTEEDLRGRVQYVRDAALWKRAEHSLNLMQRTSRALLYISLGAFLWSIFSFASKCGTYANKRNDLLIQVATENPAGLTQFLRNEDTLQKLVLDMEFPQSFVDKLQDKSNSTLPELRSLRKSVQSAMGRMKWLGIFFVSDALLRFLHRGSKRVGKYLDRRRRLILDGASAERADVLAAEGEALADLNTEEKSTLSREAAEALAIVPKRRKVEDHNREETYAGADTNDWHTSTFAAVDKIPNQPLGTSTMEDVNEQEDRSFFEAVQNVQRHWNAAALLTPDQLEQYSLVVVVPDDVTSADQQERTRLLLVYDGEEQQEPYNTQEEQYNTPDEEQQEKQYTTEEEQQEELPSTQPDMAAGENGLEGL